MNYLVWTLYFLLTLITSMILRKIFINKISKRISFAIILSLFATPWFLYPGSREIAPVISIYFVDLIESGNFIQQRLVRPVLSVFFLILTLDLILLRYKSKN